MAQKDPLSTGKIVIKNGGTVETEGGTDIISVSTAGVATISGTAALTAGSVGTTELADNAITTVKITDANVTTAKLAADAVTNAKLADDAVSLENLDAGITPSHIAVFSGTVTWTGSGATLADTVTGVAATDIIQATIQSAPTQAAYLVSAAPTTDTITYTLSAANTSNDAVIQYTVFRAAA